MAWRTDRGAPTSPPPPPRRAANRSGRAVPRSYGTPVEGGDGREFARVSEESRGGGSGGVRRSGEGEVTLLLF